MMTAVLSQYANATDITRMHKFMKMKYINLGIDIENKLLDVTFTLESLEEETNKSLWAKIIFTNICISKWDWHGNTISSQKENTEDCN